MALTQSRMILNVLQLISRRTTIRHLHPGVGNCSPKPKPGKGKGLAQSKFEADYLTQKSFVADFVKKGNLVGLNALKQQILKAGTAMNEFTFDAHFIGICSELGSFELGRDYFIALHSEGRAGMGAIGRYFALCHAFPDKIGPSDQELMLKVYDAILQKHDVLDVSTCEAVALGIGLTKRWRTEIPRLLDMVKHSGSTPSSSLWLTAIESAFYHQESSVAWEYMESYVNSGKPIVPRLFEVVLKQKGTVLQLLRWLEKHGFILTVESAEVFKQFATPHGVTSKSSLVSRKGLCKACHKTLQPSNLSTEDFELLRTAFLDPVLVGRDVFQKTSPEELKKFHNFLEKVLPVDVVLDGLNIAYVSKRLSPNGSKLLRSVTSHFVSEGHRILVIGREHMNKWAASDMNYIRNHASVFLAENLSQDDPFLLYAALKSGVGTCFVSRDRMSGHKFLLGQPHLRHVFSKWQALHQYHPRHISEDGNSVALRPPTLIAREPQQTAKNVWHLPVVDHSQTNVEGHLQDERAPWLCLQRISSHTEEDEPKE